MSHGFKFNVLKRKNGKDWKKSVKLKFKELWINLSIISFGNDFKWKHGCTLVLIGFDSSQVKFRIECTFF